MNKERFSRNRDQTQSGIALISVLGVIAMITAIIAGLTYRQQLSINLQGYAMQKSTGFLAVISAEQMASAILADRDKDRVHTSYDYQDELWGEPEINKDVGGSIVSFMIFDAQAKFNVNNVNARNGGNRAVAKRVLRSMLNRYGKTHNDINDWVSARRILSKDRQYLAGDTQFDSYRLANTEMVSLNELRLLASLRQRETLEGDLSKFEDYFSFFPTNREFIKVNVNTAGDVFLTELLRYFGASSRAATILEGRPYRSASIFCAQVRSRRGDCRRMVSVKSSYFYVLSRAQLGDTVLQARSLLRRTQGGTIETIMRQTKTL